MVTVTITNYADSGAEPVILEDCVDGKFVGIHIKQETARVSVDELERAIEACKHQYRNT